MACEFICDGCGKRAPAYVNRKGDWFMPCAWFTRTDEGGTQVACSRECLDKVAKATGKTSVVIP